MDVMSMWDRIVASPVGQQVLSDQAAELVARRKALAAERATARAELETAAQAAEQVKTKALAKVQTARAAWDDALRHAEVVTADGRSGLAALERRINQAEKALHETADWARINDTHTVLRALERDVIQAPVTEVLRFGHRMQAVITGNDHAARVTALTSIRMLDRGLDALALEPTTTAELDRRLASVIAEAKAAIKAWHDAEVTA